MKMKKIILSLELNIVIVILNIIIFSPGIIGVNIDFNNIFQTSIGITVIVMSVIIFIVGNYKILIEENDDIGIFNLDNYEDYIEALKDNSNKKIFYKDIDSLLDQIERINKKQEKIDDILLQKFTANEISYTKFK